MDGFCLTVEFPLGGPAISYSINLFEIYLHFFFNFYVFYLLLLRPAGTEKRWGD